MSESFFLTKEHKMEYKQSGLDRVKVFIRGKEVFGALYSAIIACFISLTYLQVEELQFQGSSLFPFVMIGVGFVVWCWGGTWGMP